MAKRKTPKKEKIVDLKSRPEKITPEELNRVQDAINKINRSQLEIGSIEVRKHELMHGMSTLREDLGALQSEFQEKYNTFDIDITDGTINYIEEDGEADKKD